MIRIEIRGKLLKIFLDMLKYIEIRGKYLKKSKQVKGHSEASAGGGFNSERKGNFGSSAGD